MATACLTIIEADGKEIAVLLKDTDGQPTGHGTDLKLLLGGNIADIYSEVRFIRRRRDISVNSIFIRFPPLAEIIT
jgi:hypothetical protein